MINSLSVELFLFCHVQSCHVQSVRHDIHFYPLAIYIGLRQSATAMKLIKLKCQKFLEIKLKIPNTKLLIFICHTFFRGPYSFSPFLTIPSIRFVKRSSCPTSSSFYFHISFHESHFTVAYFTYEGSTIAFVRGHLSSRKLKVDVVEIVVVNMKLVFFLAKPPCFVCVCLFSD